LPSFEDEDLGTDVVARSVIYRTPSPPAVLDGKDECPKRVYIGGVIGNGTFGTVHEGVIWNRAHGYVPVAVKTGDRDSPLCDEWALAQIHERPHPHLMDYLGTYERADITCVILPLCPRGTLSQMIHSTTWGGRTEHVTMSHVLVQMAQALDHMHNELGLVHMDVKPDNVLVRGDRHFCLSDFGCSRSLGQSGLGGTVPFMAPEVVRNEEVNGAADTWSLGCIIHCMLTGSQHPYVAQVGNNQGAIIYGVGVGEFVPHVREDGPFDRIALACTRQRPEDRFELVELQ